VYQFAIGLARKPPKILIFSQSVVAWFSVLQGYGKILINQSGYQY
jgi:hypothetical protein